MQIGLEVKQEEDMGAHRLHRWVLLWTVQTFTLFLFFLNMTYCDLKLKF